VSLLEVETKLVEASAGLMGRVRLAAESDARSATRQASRGLPPEESVPLIL